MSSSFLFAVKPVARFEIVDRADPLFNYYGIAYRVDYGLWILIRHGAFVEGVGADGGGEDAIHALFEIGEGEAVLRLRAAEEPSRAVGSALVPVIVAEPCADECPVAHVERDQQALTLTRRDRALSQDHVLHVDIVVDGREEIRLVQLQRVQYALLDDLAVERGEALHERHVVKVAVPVLPCEIGELKGDPGLLPAADIRVRLVLIVFRDLQAEIAAACVDDKIEVLLVVAVDLDEMVASAERAEALLGTAGFDLLAAAQLFDIDSSVAAVRPFAHVSPVGDVLADERIELWQVKALFFEAHDVHAAADIDADEVRDDVFANRHSRADGAALSRVHVGHYPDLRSRRERLIAERFYLTLRRGLEDVGVDFCGGVGAGELNHFTILSVAYKSHLLYMKAFRNLDLFCF